VSSQINPKKTETESEHFSGWIYNKSGFYSDEEGYGLELIDLK